MFGTFCQLRPCVHFLNMEFYCSKPLVIGRSVGGEWTKGQNNHYAGPTMDSKVQTYVMHRLVQNEFQTLRLCVLLVNAGADIPVSIKIIFGI